jgi:hypothetical protein
MVEDARTTLVKTVAYRAHVEHKYDVLQYLLDPRERTTNRMCFQRLKEKFGIDKMQILSEELIYLVLYEDYSARREQLQPKGILLSCPEFEIDVRGLNGHFNRQVEVLQQRDEVVRDLARAILEKGYTYELVFESILGIRNITSATIDRT